MEVSKYISTVLDVHGRARDNGLFFLDCSGVHQGSRVIEFNDQPYVSFSSCSYLGLEFHPALIAGVEDAVRLYGTQFSSSRGYVSAPPYAELETALEDIFGGYVVVTSSTTIGHQISIPTLVTERDAIIFDNQVHHSVQQAITLARANGAKAVMVKHREIYKAIELVAELSRKHHTVWFACDGVYSMYGDMLAGDFLRSIVETAPNVRLYVDDAHGMSWAGVHGRGSFLSRFELSPQVVVATSLNKAFAASGGVLVFSSATERDRVRLSGSPYVFSGPIQPPMLGAAIASASIHLSEEISEFQDEFARKIRFTNEMIKKYELPLLEENSSPIFFLKVGQPQHAIEVARRVKEDGFYINVSMYPSVPLKRSGIRLSITRLHEEKDIEAMLRSLSLHLPQVLAEEGVEDTEISNLFVNAVPLKTSGCSVQRYRTIRDIDEELWDSLLGKAGTCSWDSLNMCERMFSNRDAPEHDWEFYYYVVRGEADEVVCATYFVLSLQKDDMVLSESISDALEEVRVDNPYYLSSVMFMMGGVLSEGNHLYVNRSQDWENGLRCLLRAVHKDFDDSRARVLMIRDIPSEEKEVIELLLREGFIQIPMLDSFEKEVTWDTTEEMISTFHNKAARRFGRRLVEAAESYSFEVYNHENKTLPREEMNKLFSLYESLAARKRKINVFSLPEDILENLLESKSWEVVVVYKQEAENRLPVSWFAAHKYEGTYAAFFCGVDVDYIVEQRYGAYRQMLLHMLLRAREAGANTLRMGMDADVEKERLGAIRVRNSIFVQNKSQEQDEELQDFIVNLNLSR